MEAAITQAPGKCRNGKDAIAKDTVNTRTKRFNPFLANWPPVIAPDHR